MSQANEPPSDWKDLLGGGAAGVGTVLVFLPVLAIILGVTWFDNARTVGLPVLAILGIMILLGTLALVAMLFKRLDLADKTQPLALPQGSMRAAIALSLIVLFAIISITLYLSLSQGGGTYKVDGLTQGQRDSILTSAGARVERVMDEPCAQAPQTTATPVTAGSSPAQSTANAAAQGGSSGSRPAASTALEAGPTALPAATDCPPERRRYAVYVRSSPAPESTDLAKQLLILVGTLMTSVTSYYFAARSGTEFPSGGAAGAAPQGQPITPAPSQDPAPARNLTPDPAAPTPMAVGSATDHGHPDDADACDVEIIESTHDDQLPVAVGGVATTTSATAGRPPEGGATGKGST